MKYNWLLKYMPPLEYLDDNDITTWRKVFYISKQECPEKLDLELKINELKKLYKMEDGFITIETLDN